MFHQQLQIVVAESTRILSKKIISYPKIMVIQFVAILKISNIPSSNNKIRNSQICGSLPLHLEKVVIIQMIGLLQSDNKQKLMPVELGGSTKWVLVEKESQDNISVLPDNLHLPQEKTVHLTEAMSIGKYKRSMLFNTTKISIVVFAIGQPLDLFGVNIHAKI